jgi:hypothetical protein
MDIPIVEEYLLCYVQREKDRDAKYYSITKCGQKRREMENWGGSQE